MQNSPIGPQLESIFDDLPSQMQAAARWLISHPLDVALLSMREQARRAGVPAVTMSRVAKRMGFDSFEDLKLLHARLLREPTASYQARAQQLISRQTTNENAFIQEMMQSSEQQLRELGSAGSAQAIERAAEILSRAERVYCLGSRACFAVAFVYHYVRSLVGADSILLDAAGGIGADGLRAATREDALLTISVSPYTRQTVDGAQFAAERGVKVVAITDGPLSPLARVADTSIIVPTETSSFFPSMTPALATAECLAALVAVKRGEPALAALAQSERQLNAFGAYISSRPTKTSGAKRGARRTRPKQRLS